MTPKEIQTLHQACIAAGVDASKIQPDNPFKKSGGVAQMLQAAVSEIDPAQAAKWRVDAGQGLSVATMAEMQGGGELSQAAMQDLWNHDSAFVVDTIKQHQQSEEQTLAMFAAEGEAMRLRNKTRQMGGNEARAREALKEEDLANQQREQQRLESAKHAQEMENRIQQQRIQSANLAGRFIN